MGCACGVRYKRPTTRGVRSTPLVTPEPTASSDAPLSQAIVPQPAKKRTGYKIKKLRK